MATKLLDVQCKAKDLQRELLAAFDRKVEVALLAGDADELERLLAFAEGELGEPLDSAEARVEEAERELAAALKAAERARNRHWQPIRA